MNRQMKRKVCIQIILMIICINLKLSAQSLNVNSQSGSNSSYSLQDVRRLTFENLNLVVLLNDGNSYSFPLATLSNYRYDGSIANIEDLLNNAKDWQILIFPNPTQNEIKIQFSLDNEEEISFSISDLSGKVLTSKNLGLQSIGEHLYVTSIQDLPKGNYVLRINRKESSFIKNITKI